MCFYVMPMDERVTRDKIDMENEYLKSINRMENSKMRKDTEPGNLTNVCKAFLAVIEKIKKN